MTQDPTYDPPSGSLLAPEDTVLPVSVGLSEINIDLDASAIGAVRLFRDFMAPGDLLLPLNGDSNIYVKGA